MIDLIALPLDEVDEQELFLDILIVYDELIIALIDENDDDEADEYMIMVIIDQLSLNDEIEQLVEVDDDEVVFVAILVAVLDV